MSRKIIGLCLLLSCSVSHTLPEKRIRNFFKKLLHRKESVIATPFITRLTQQNLSHFFPQATIYTLNKDDVLMHRKAYPISSDHARTLLENTPLISLSWHQLQQLAHNGNLDFVLFYTTPSFNVRFKAFAHKYFCIGIIVPDIEPATAILLERTMTPETNIQEPAPILR